MKNFLNPMKTGINKILSGTCICFFIVVANVFSNSITNVTVANVTPSTFTVIWQAPESVPSIDVYSDANGSTNLQGEIGVEFFPVHTGSPLSQNDYLRRNSKSMIRQRMQKSGIYAVRIHNCKPDTSYYFKISSTVTNNNQTMVYPPTGLIEVKTPKTNSFVLDARQLVVNIPGSNTLGRVLILSHEQAMYPLAAIVGDGCPTTNAVFNVCDLFALSGGNFSPDGSQQFKITMLADNESYEEEFVLNFTNAFSVANSSAVTFAAGYEQTVLEIGNALVSSGSSAMIPISIETTVPLTNIQFTIQFSPSDLILNPSFASLSPLIDATNARITQPQTGIWSVSLPVKSGQSISGLITNIAIINFSTPSGISSTIVSPMVTEIFAFKANGSLVDYNYAKVGKIVIISSQPVLEAGLTRTGERMLSIYGASGATYQIQSTTRISTQTVWKSETQISLVNTNFALIPLPSTNQIIFYRAVELSTDRFESSVSEKEKIRVKNETKPIKILPALPYNFGN